jgi:predicted ArsR family transcriptional regulator
MAKRPEREMKGTRGRILRRLRRSGQTVTELAAELGISDNAVRTHVTGLERDGLVETSAEMRMTGGKPAQVYELTVAGTELFPRAYPRFLAELLGVLEDRQVTATVRRLLREAGRRAAGEPAAGKDVRRRVELAAAALESLGGDVEIEQQGAVLRIRGHGCPLSAVVAEQPSACVMAEAFVSAMVGRPVVEKCEKGERPRCLFEVRL